MQLKINLPPLNQRRNKGKTTIKKIFEPKGMTAKDLLEKVAHSVPIDSSLSPCDSLAKMKQVYRRK
jgi:hypothetical protein